MSSPMLLACGSNGSAQLALSHSDDVNILTRCVFHPSIEHLLPGSTVVDLVSSATHSLTLLRTRIGQSDSPDAEERNILLGAGTNTLGQLGPRCALWDEVKAETRWKVVDLLGPLQLEHTEWEPVKVAATWTTSFVVYRKRSTRAAGSAASGNAGAAAGSDDGRGHMPQEMVVSCGSDDFGELGSTRSQAGAGRIAVTSPSDKSTVVDLGLVPGETVELLKGGQRHVIAVIRQRDGQQRVVGWGASRKGELDLATLATSAAGPSASSTQTIPSAGGSSSSKGKGKAKAVSRPTTSPPTVIGLPRLMQSDETVVDIALGSSHSVAMTSAGRVLAWGNDQKGQISGLGAMSGVEAIAATWGGSYCLVEDEQSSGRKIVSQGSNTHSQLLRDGTPTDHPAGGVDLPQDFTIDGMIAGTEHLLVYGTLNGAHALLAGGWNEHGNLGLGDEQDRSRLTRVDLGPQLDGSYRIKRVWAGCAATWVYLEQAKE